MEITPTELLEKVLNNMKKDTITNKEAMNIIQGLAHQLSLPHNEDGVATADSFTVRVPVVTENTKWMMVMNVSMYEVRK